eukprot:CAMPEP_0197040072 /NCGR_PEP_ID=MMETSP1384-20130603/16821_1 /TAXON_ID=29189 /ORGANISM="Ammonia sp." /LENGTH=189 /DNA_ID=CAMNT_0042470759 /DNA_START=31 /DNA_END=600 /DNA_ORIENTATION=-
MTSSPVPQCKVVVVGDGAIGKTCLLTVYTNGTFPEEYIPTVFDNYSELKEIAFDHPKPHKKTIRLDLWDTAGQEEFDRIRPLSYRDANYFLICFAVNSELSFDHIREKWVPEIKHHAPNKGFVLVGLKSDLECVVPKEQIDKLRKEIDADAYIQASALKKNNVDLVFETAMKNYYKHRDSVKTKTCVLL